MQKSESAQPGLLVGILVGGESKRMGRAKGQLQAPDGSGRTLVARLIAEVRHALLDSKTRDSELVLVGERSEYADYELEKLTDARPDSGPLGGIVALLERAALAGQARVLVLACDLPYVSAELIARLANGEPTAALLCPHLEGRYQPLFARYDVSLLPTFREALVEARLSMQPLLKELRATQLSLSQQEQSQLRDWDTPQDASL